MENQYNYYTSDQDKNTENYGTGSYGQTPEKDPKKKNKKGAAKWAKVVCTGLVFGVVASAAFQTSNIEQHRLRIKQLRQQRQPVMQN